MKQEILLYAPFIIAGLCFVPIAWWCRVTGMYLPHCTMDRGGSPDVEKMHRGGDRLVWVLCHGLGRPVTLRSER